MKMKKVPMRTCVVSHEKLMKKDLLRVQQAILIFCMENR